MKKTLQLRSSTLAVLLALACSHTLVSPTPAATPAAVLKHRYSFNETSGDIAKDSAGTADGKLIAASFTGNGKVDLVSADSAYIDLPNGIISALTNASFEAWVTFDGEDGAWQRIFDFGNNANGEDQQGSGTTYIFLTARVGGNGVLRFAATLDPNGTPREIPILDGPILPTGTNIYVVVTYNFAEGIGKLYYNGALVSSGQVTLPLSQIQDVNNWLGRSNWPDAFFDGQFDEFRISEGILTDQQIAIAAALGPNNVGGDLGATKSIRMELSTNAIVVGGLSAQATVFGDFQNVSNVNVTTFAETTYASSDTQIATVTATGRIDPVGGGSATITATYQGKQATASLTVSGGAGAKANLVHRYSFSEAPGSTTVKDSVGTADGALVGTGDFTGDGKLNLSGVDGYVDLPNGIISSLTNATFETWITWNSARTWERIFDLGSSTGGEDVSGTGETYLFLTPLGGSGVVRFAITVNSGAGETPVLNGAAALSTNQQTHLVVTYNMDIGAARLYVNGQRVASGAATIPLNTINDINVWLGRSQWNDPFFTGQYNEFRIYEGALTEEQVALSAAAGPDTLGANSGNLQTLRLVVSTNSLTPGGLSAAATAFADFANVTNVNVTTLPTTQFSSSDTSIATVSAAGVIEPVAAGSATILVAYGGKQASAAVTVTASTAPPPKLIHRYSFTDAVGSTTIKDSVGSANGTLKGTGTLGGGKLVLDGTDGYVDLPNRLISVLTDATFEVWVTPRNTRVWERIFDFGSNSNGEDNQGTGVTFFYLSPRGGSQAVRVGFVTGGGVPNLDIDGPGLLPDNQESHLAVVVNDTLDALRVYVNGQRVAIGVLAHHLAGLDDYNVWLGRSNWPDPFFTGDFNEFRIYDGALSDAAVAASFAAGPDASTTSTQPTLAITHSGTQLTISWPVEPAGFVLESSLVLGTAAKWTAVGGNLLVENGLNKVTVSITGTATFYRLRK